MVALDESSLICDLAEAYHVFDWRSLPPFTAAALACGLGADSRIIRKISGAPAPVNTLLLAMITDALNTIAWQNTKDAQAGRNRPKSVLRAIMSAGAGEEAESASFDSVEEFGAWRAAMMEGNNNG